MASLFSGNSVSYRILNLFVCIVILFSYWKVPIMRATPPGSVIRWCFGEAGAIQLVNNNIDIIRIMGWDKELEVLCDKILNEYLPIYDSLPRAKFGKGHKLPDRLFPKKFRILGGLWGEPVLVLRNHDDKVETSLAFLWGNGRHNIVIYQKPPDQQIKGNITRKISERVYVYAGES
jgi:hypothetical protein